MRGAFVFIAALMLVVSLGAGHAAGTAKVDRIVVEKAKHTLTLYAAGEVVKVYRVAIGVGPRGNKVNGGDDRTPEGSYIIDSKNPKSAFHRALHISYPNKQDRDLARQRRVHLGALIAIHGTPEFIERIQNGAEHPDWTAGCIGVRNTEIEEIYALVPVGTPIEIKP